MKSVYNSLIKDSPQTELGWKIPDVLAYLKLLRLRHWVKNFFLFAAPFFGGKIFDDGTAVTAIPAFAAFSLCASAVYIFNDIRDREQDRCHPEKKHRPIASGHIAAGQAAVIALFFFVVSCLVSYMVGKPFLFYMLAYAFIQFGYSIYLKHIQIMDIFCIASGFVLRVIAGGAAFNVEVSNWLLLTMFMISLVLATGKRLTEVQILHEEVENHRKSLNNYSISTLREILLITSGAALICYALYTIEQFKSLVHTVPIVTFGLFRYLLLSKHGIGDPTDALTKDKWLAVTLFIWLLLVGLIRYN